MTAGSRSVPPVRVEQFWVTDGTKARINHLASRHSNLFQRARADFPYVQMATPGQATPIAISEALHQMRIYFVAAGSRAGANERETGRSCHGASPLLHYSSQQTTPTPMNQSCINFSHHDHGHAITKD